jgi:D-alanine-D-alanine ligase
LRLNVGVVFGGRSVEHEVSIISALQMIENMNCLKYNPIPIYLSKANEFLYHSDMKRIDFFKDLNNVVSISQRLIFIKNGEKIKLFVQRKNRLKQLTDIDLIFLVVHGSGCEDGTLSAYFTLLNIPFVGSSILSASLFQNKWKSKALFAYHDVPIVPYIGFYDEDYYLKQSDIISACEKHGYPLIVKPASLGSSIGICKCDNQEQLHKAIVTAIEYDTEIIVEKYVENLIELNCSVLGDYYHYETSAIERVFQIDEILSYQDKYLRGAKNTKGIENTSRELPANISEDLKKEIESLSLRIIKIVGGSGVIRIDYLYDSVLQKLYLNEVNSIPGSLAFYLWTPKGKEYRKLIDDLINIALKRYSISNAKIDTYNNNLLDLNNLSVKGKLS